MKALKYGPLIWALRPFRRIRGTLEVRIGCIVGISRSQGKGPILGAHGVNLRIVLGAGMISADC